MKHFFILLSLLILNSCSVLQRNERFIAVDKMICNEVKDIFSERQLSELTDTEKFLVRDSEECGIAYPDVRIRKDLILRYMPSFSISLGVTDDKYKDDPSAPLHVTKINIEHCRVYIGESNKTSVSMDISLTCKELSELL